MLERGGKSMNLTNTALQEAIDYPVADTLDEIINSVNLHLSECPLCANPRVSEIACSMLSNGNPLIEISLRLSIPTEKIKEHLKEMFALSSVDIYAKLALLKIISAIHYIETDKIRTSDIVKAIDTLVSFSKKGQESNTASIKPNAHVSSVELLNRRIGKK